MVKILLLFLLPVSAFSQVDTLNKRVLHFYVSDRYKPAQDEVQLLKNKRGGKIIAYRRHEDEDWVLVDTVATLKALLKAQPKSY